MPTSQYLIIIDWVAVERGYDVVRPETPNDYRLITSPMVYAKASN